MSTQYILQPDLLSRRLGEHKSSILVAVHTVLLQPKSKGENLGEVDETFRDTRMVMAGV